MTKQKTAYGPFDRSGPARIEIGRGLLSRLGERIRACGLKSRVFLLAPRKVLELLGGRVTASLEAASLPWEEILVRDGDREKTMDQAAEIIDRLAGSGASRDSTAVALGGGVTTDLCGFAASIYMRGIPLVFAPTTLLAQVDAAIGGKVGVNRREGKNLVGSFYQPRLVLSDPDALKSLDDGEIAEGMAEVVKTALIGSPDLFSFLERELAEDPGPKLRDGAFLERCVATCAKVKGGIVERDPFERGERRVLNLGHTLGHALEAAAAYSGLTHGRAVSVGLAAALRIARSRGLAAEDLPGRTEALLKRCGLPVEAPPVDKELLRKAISLDKKKREGRLNFVLPTGIGSVIVVNDVTEEEIEAAARRF